jgi:hypothetical protein
VLPAANLNIHPCIIRYERARLKYDAFRLEVDAAIARGDDGERLGRMKANRDESEMRMMQLQQQGAPMYSQLYVQPPIPHTCVDVPRMPM